MNIKNIIRNIIKKHPFIRKLARKVSFYKNKIKYSFITNRIEVDEKLIIFGCFNGRSYCDSPKAIYNYLINDDRFNES